AARSHDGGRSTGPFSYVAWRKPRRTETRRAGARSSGRGRQRPDGTEPPAATWGTRRTALATGPGTAGPRPAKPWTTGRNATPCGKRRKRLATYYARRGSEY